jgi:oligoribonuclease NrnB/cAMP/cGMP phosphodiesterase (DHH superfamily)
VNKAFVFYHALCIDGYAAAATMWRAFPDATYRAIHYGEPLPLDGVTKGDTLYFVDFAPPPEEITTLSELQPARIVILDHHASMIDAYGNADCPEFQAVLKGAHVELTLDKTRSGAGLTWEHLYPDTPLPYVLACVQDRDLWKFALPDSRDFYEYFILFLNKPFAEFNRLVDDVGVVRDGVFGSPLSATAYLGLKEASEALKEKRDVEIQFHLDNCLTEWPFGDSGKLAVVNCHRPITSELSDRIKDSYDVVACYFHRKMGSMVSLRSKDYNVRYLAEKLGGGGHKNAAGVEMKFAITPETLAAMLFDADKELSTASEVENG